MKAASIDVKGEGKAEKKKKQRMIG